MRIFLPEDISLNKTITVSNDKAHYLISVLRVKTGEEFEVFDRTGSCFNARVTGIGKNSILLHTDTRIDNFSESPLHMVLVQGMLKGEKMDLVIQKTTELGVKDICPVITERCQVRETRKTGRWRKIAEEAAEQSGRNVIPVIHEPVEFDLFLSGQVPEGKNHGLTGFIFYEKGGLPLKEAFSKLKTPNAKLFVAIGPEGGFTEKEVEAGRNSGLVVTTLGKRILRAETAAVSSLTLIQYELGDLGI